MIQIRGLEGSYGVVAAVVAIVGAPLLGAVVVCSSSGCTQNPRIFDLVIILEQNTLES